MFKNNTTKGKRNERLTENWLIAHGFKIVLRGKSLGRGKGNTHYDLIAENEQIRYAIDVKSGSYLSGLKMMIKEAASKNQRVMLIFVENSRVIGVFVLIAKP